MQNAFGRAAVLARVLCTAWLLVLLPAASHAQATGTVRGKVTRVDGGSPVSGVSVTVRGGGAAAVTGPDGTYQLDRVEAGQRTIVFRWPGYQPQEAQITVTAGATATADAARWSRAIAVPADARSASKSDRSRASMRSLAVSTFSSYSLSSGVT